MNPTENQGVLLPSPIEHLLTNPSGIELYIKREDLIHPTYGGNKWRKLKYNLAEYKSGSYTRLITFGGPFSNHIAAVAQVCRIEGIPSVGLIRGTYIDVYNPTLIAARKAGMQLIHISKEAYGEKQASSKVKDILAQYSHPFIIPEGGGNALGFRGCEEISEELMLQELDFDYIIVPAGTGTTAAGVISKSPAETLVVNVLKNPSLEDVIAGQVPDDKRWRILSDYHFGGFAKVDKTLVDFINAFFSKYNLRLDPIYNGKGLYAAMDLIHTDRFAAGSKVLYILTGGLQGITAYNYRCKREALLLTV